MTHTTLVLALGAVLAAPLSAQTVPAPGAVAGRVLDARSGEPVEHALVTLEPGTGGLLPDGAAAVLVAARVQLTGASGAYRFGEVGPGVYRLRIERLGYRSASVDVEVRRSAGVSVALELAPVHLEPLRVAQRSASWYMPVSASAADALAARMGAERLREQYFLAPDARVLTYGDVIDGVTFGEADVFRALQRVPGIGTRDDYSAELWTRGAPWPHTRVTFDGMPLFNPVHAVGVLSAMAPEALGAVYFHPGVRPASYAEGAAGVVDLRSRSGGGGGRVRGVADLSMASAKLSLDQHIAGRAAWAVTARRSHLDVLSGGIDWLGVDSLDLPFVFHDITGRIDIEPGRGVRLESSALWEEDRLTGDVAGVLERTTARWGNGAGRATLRVPWRGLELSQTTGVSRFAVRTEAHQVRGVSRAWTEPPARNEIRHVQVSGAIVPVADGVPPRWSVGYDVAWQTVDYDGPPPRTHAVRPDTTRRIRYARELRVAGVYADARLAVGPLSLHPGVRGDHAGGVAGGVLRVGPRFAARVRLSPVQSIALAAGRSWQHTQALALAGPSVHPAFHASHFWIWADSTTPALRADIVSIGAERWLGGGWIAAATVHARRSTGMVVPDPAPGRLGQRPVKLAGENEAHGVELSARRLGVRWSSSIAWARGTSTITAAGRTFPSPADRRELLDVTTTVRLPYGLRTGAAFTAMSGAPFTRAYSSSAADCQSFGFGCDNPSGAYVEEPNAERTPAYRSLDAVMQWGRAVRGVEVSAYLQVRNVLGRDNASTYSGSRPVARVQTPAGPQILWEDRFEHGLPRLPLFGLRAAF